MFKREVLMPVQLVHEVRRMVHEEGYAVLSDAFKADQEPPIFLSVEEAEALVTLAVIEKRKAWLRYPYHSEVHPKYSPEHEDRFDDVQMGIYEKILHYVTSAFSKHNFDSLL